MRHYSFAITIESGVPAVEVSKQMWHRS